MAAAVAQNFRLHIGEDVTVAFTVTDADGANVNLTGNSVAWAMRTHELATADTLTIAGSSLGDGTFSIVFVDTNTDAINPGVYYHEAKYTDASLNESVVVRGSVQLDPSIT